MKFSKLTLAAVITAASVFGTVGTAIFAADPTEDATITVNKALSGTYNVYQLFTGTFTADGNMGDITVNPAYKDDIVKAIQHFDTSFTLDTTATEVSQSNTLANKITSLCNGENTKEGRAFANYLAGIITANPTTTADAADGTVTVSNMTTGYYLISAAAANTTAKTSAILIPAKSGTNQVDLKATQPVATKTAVENGATGAGATSVDQEISNGKILPPTYTIQGTVASNIADYSTYPYSIIDTLPKGVVTTTDEVSKDWNVTITATNGSTTTPLTTDATTTVSTDGNVITWSFTDLKALLTAANITDADLPSTTVTVTYTPVYDDADLKALYGTDFSLDTPFTNVAQLKFASDPYEGGNGTTTPTDPAAPGSQVKAYSYNLKITKQDADTKPVTGSTFQITDADGNVIGNNITASDDGTFNFTGLKSGVEYTLTETAVPAGYEKINPITFTIAETKDASGAISGITVTKGSDPSNAGAFVTDGATVNATIVNTAGPIMPGTGQAGMLLAGGAGVAVIAISAIAAARKKK